MKLTMQVKLLPTPLQAAALEETLHACNEAATRVSQVAFETSSAISPCVSTPTQVRDRWMLGAQAAPHVIKKTCDSYRTLRANLTAGNLGRPSSKRCRRATEKPIALRPAGAQPYDDRMLSWQYTERTVSIWTLSGRMKQVAFTASPEQLARLALYRKGESDLLYRDGMWFLIATCEAPEAELNTSVTQFLGIDLGIVNIATTSDGPDAGSTAGACASASCVRNSRRRTPRPQTAPEEAASQGGAAGTGHQPQDREACGGRGRAHRSRNRSGRPYDVVLD
ncbi:hypothetical protein [Streptomyces sp. NPDC055105]|uniref:hypothetical protein n=1 Tax=Streptomyces sp. NPDC055105 TaxID=3365719 RepID=UPI0037D98E13